MILTIYMIEKYYDAVIYRIMSEKYKKDPLDIHNLNNFIDEILSTVHIGLPQEAKLNINPPIKEESTIIKNENKPELTTPQKMEFNSNNKNELNKHNLEKTVFRVNPTKNRKAK